MNNFQSAQHQQRRKIKVFIVEDGMSIRLLLQKIINAQPDMEVVGMAEHPLQASEKLREITPDVMTLDVEMPHMSGLTFLKKIMKLRPLPVIMISTRTEKNSDDAIRALEIGAVDVIGKPSQRIADIATSSEKITNAIRAASAARLGARTPFNEHELQQPATDASELDKFLPLPANLPENRPPLMMIGASTGGTEAVLRVVSNLPTQLPPLLIAQHMPAGSFTASFARRLNLKTAITIVEAENRMPLEKGHAYIAPGGKHFLVKYLNGTYYCQLHEGPSISRHKPSVDCLFRSGLIAAGKNVCAAILTGMGEDGVKALGNIKSAGGHTMAQNEATCIVYGMPRRAKEANAICESLSPEDIAKKFIEKNTNKEPVHL